MIAGINWYLMCCEGKQKVRGIGCSLCGAIWRNCSPNKDISVIMYSCPHCWKGNQHSPKSIETKLLRNNWGQKKQKNSSIYFNFISTDESSRNIGSLHTSVISCYPEAFITSHPAAHAVVVKAVHPPQTRCPVMLSAWRPRWRFQLKKSENVLGCAEQAVWSYFCQLFMFCGFAYPTFHQQHRL